MRFEIVEPIRDLIVSLDQNFLEIVIIRRFVHDLLDSFES